MNDWALPAILAITGSYLIGSMPFAYLVARKAKGMDIRKIGTGNVGAVNTLREVGILPGIVVLLLDIGKGSASVLLSRFLDLPLVFVLFSGLVVLAGHCWPIFLGFKGGGGAATSMGVLLVVTPLEFAITFAATLPIFVISRNTRLATGTGLLLLPLVIWAFGREVSFILYPLAVFLFLVLRNMVPLKRDLERSPGLKEFLFRQYPPLRRQGKSD